MLNSKSSLHIRGNNDDPNRLSTQLGLPNHTIYAGLKPPYINMYSDPPKRDPVQRHPRVQYTSNPALGYEGTHYSHHLSTPTARLAVHGLEWPR
jgi:hypothetical protein